MAVGRGEACDNRKTAERVHPRAWRCASCARQVGHALIEQYPDNWQEKLVQLQKIDWSRENAKVWEGRAMVGGRINKSQTNLTLTTGVIKHFLGLQLTPDELNAEENLSRGGRSANA